MDRVPTHEQMLEHYRRKPLRKFLQIEGWREDTPRMGWPNYTDRNGRVIQTMVVWELRNTDFPIRIQVPMDAPKEEVLILLKKAIRRLASDWEDCHMSEVNNPT